MIITLTFDTDANSIDHTDEFGEPLSESEFFDSIKQLRDALDIALDPNTTRIDEGDNYLYQYSHH